MSLLTNYSSNINLKIRTNPGKRLSLPFEILPIKSTGQLSLINGLHASEGENKINLIKK